MSHEAHGDVPGPSHQAGGNHADGDGGITSLLEEEQTLLGMLHVPLLHGGVTEVLLLSGLSTSSTGGFVFACLVLLLVTLGLEFLRLLAWWVERRLHAPHGSSLCVCQSNTCLDSDPKSYKAMQEQSSSQQRDFYREDSSTPITQSQSSAKVSWWTWMVSGGLHFLTYLTSTLLMLIAMTMNIYLIVCMGLGAALGHVGVALVKKRLCDTQALG